VLLQDLGDHEGAMRAWGRALAIGPDLQQPRDNLEEFGDAP